MTIYQPTRAQSLALQFLAERGNVAPSDAIEALTEAYEDILSVAAKSTSFDALKHDTLNSINIMIEHIYRRAEDAAFEGATQS